MVAATAKAQERNLLGLLNKWAHTAGTIAAGIRPRTATISFNYSMNSVGENMNRTLQQLLVGFVMTLGLGALATAGEAMDPVLGTWTLDLSKSKFTPASIAPKSQTRTYAQTADGISLTVTGTAADGSPISQQSTFKYDGKDYAISGSADYDTLSLKRVNGSTVNSAMMRGGKRVGSTVRTISHHGKELTLTSHAKNAAGKAYSIVAVYTKQ